MEFDLEYFNKNKGKLFTNLFLDMCLDVLIAQPAILMKLDYNQERQLMSEASNKIKIKKQLGNSLYKQNTTAVILSRILTSNNISIQELDESERRNFLAFNNYFILSDESLIKKVNNQAELFLRN